jgi:uncharacterized protein YbjT (DUF2867 family)
VLVTVFGATGSIGQHVVRQATAAGHDVRGFTRDPSKGAQLPDSVTWIAGDLADAGAIGKAVEGSDGVLWAVGPTRNTVDQVDLFGDAARWLVNSMELHAVKRLVALSGAGIAVRGERKPLGGRIMSAVVRRMATHVLAAKQREYEVFSASSLDWTLVRPPRVVDGAPTGRLAAGPELRGNRATAGDVAEFMVRELTERTYVRGAPFIASA